MKNNAIPLTLISILSDGLFYTNKQLSESVGVNQEVINKHVQTLRNWGVNVFTVSGEGYRLSEPIQLLNRALFQDQLRQGSVVILPVIDSTNQYLLDHLDALHSGDTCIAEYQQAGRGRRGRKWISSFGSDLCFSMYWRFERGPASVISLSLVICIVIAEILHDLGANQIRVKWPNDLYLLDRKLAGILIELTSKIGNEAQVVIGVGINLKMRSIQAEKINQNWINLRESGVIIDRNMLIIKLIKGLQCSLEQFEKSGPLPFLSRWEQLNNFINCPVKLIVGDKEIYGISRGINDQGALLLDQNGFVRPWMSGEISLCSVE